MIAALTQKLIANEELTGDEVGQAADAIMAGQASPVEIAAFLTAMHIRGETVEEIVAFARILRGNAAPFRPPTGIVLDTCGTGGDHRGTFNISTAAALIAAGAGVKVAKHGNRSMTSKCGSADVLTALGVDISCDRSVMERALDEAGICFLFAQQYHQSMRHVAQVRRELGFRTIFNLLGPLANPAGASHQLIGVYRRELVTMHAEALKRLGSTRALVVHGDDGLDELTTTTTTYAAELKDGAITTHLFQPEDFGMRLVYPEVLKGGESAANAQIIVEILDASPGPHSDIAILNAGAAIYVAEQAETIQEGIEQAREAVKSGAARQSLEKLREITCGQQPA
jgi:anthranilate phosphoribosyltransferase